MSSYDPDLVRETRKRYQQRREASQAAAGGSEATPASLERTLSSISDEVTAEAVERRERAAKVPGSPP
jgi:hypothetical protein